MNDLDRPVTRRELREELHALATKEDLKAFPTKEDLNAYATKKDFKTLREEMNGRFDELRTHFDVVGESFRSQFSSLHDWVEANTNSLATRVETLETGHGGRLLSLEGRVTRIEKRRK